MERYFFIILYHCSNQHTINGQQGTETKSLRDNNWKRVLISKRYQVSGINTSNFNMFNVKISFFLNVILINKCYGSTYSTPKKFKHMHQKHGNIMKKNLPHLLLK